MEQANTDLIFSEEFFKKSFPEKRQILHQFLLENNEFKIGEEALCFEDRQADNEGSGHLWFMSGNDTNQKLKTLTANKFYKILDVKDNDIDLVIKIEGDTGRKSWVMANRFLVANSVVRKLRAEKIKRLNDIQE